MRNSVGNDTRGVRRFCREVGMKPTAANVELIQREVSRSQTENERVQIRARETGRGGTRDAQGRDVVAMHRERVKKEIERRAR